MRNLIKADMWRVRKSKILYIGFFILLFICLEEMLHASADEGDMSARAVIQGIQQAIGGDAAGAVLITVPIFFAVFSNELSSKSMQCVLGHGITREKLIISKLLDALNLVIIDFILLTGYAAFYIFASDGGTFSAAQKTNLYIYLWINAIRFFGYIVFSAMVMYLTNSAAGGIITSVVLAFLIKAMLRTIDYFAGTSIYDYSFEGLLGETYAVIEAGGFAWQIFPALLYIVAAIAVTIIFFQRKEFEF